MCCDFGMGIGSCYKCANIQWLLLILAYFSGNWIWRDFLLCPEWETLGGGYLLYWPFVVGPLFCSRCAGLLPFFSF